MTEPDATIACPRCVALEAALEAAKRERDIAREARHAADVAAGNLMFKLGDAEALVRLLGDALEELTASVLPHGIGTADLGPCFRYYHAKEAAGTALTAFHHYVEKERADAQRQD